jgi:ribosomal subunit interface protein
MNLRISGKNMDVGEALRETATGYITAAVAKYFDGGFDGHVTLEPEGHGFRADCVIHLDSGVVLQAHATANDAIAAYEAMAGHIEKRLRRYKRKLKSHRRKSEHGELAASAYILAAPDSDDEVEEDFSPPIIAESTENLRGMSVGEAVMELDLAQSDVVVFRHAGHGGVNVVYRRADGNIGWIDPAATTN